MTDRLVADEPGAAAVERSAIVRTLADAGCVAADEEADLLIAATVGDRGALDALVARRVAGEPVAWLTGTVSFCGIDVAIEPGVYVPRPQTELLVRRAVEQLPPHGVAVDLCTGSGAVAIALSAARPDATIVATELDPAAARCARRNGVAVVEGFLDDPLPRDLMGRVDVMTAIAPYVPTDAMRLLPRDVQAFEPRLALDGGERGLEVLDAVVDRSTRWLRPGARLVVELGEDQVDPVSGKMGARGFDHPEVIRDEEGDARGLSARRSLSAQSSGVT